MALSIFSFIVLIFSIIIVHELGHYVIARWCGVYIETFSIGFGSELVSFVDKRGTHWKFCPILLGGYVRMRSLQPYGMDVGGGGSPYAEGDQTVFEYQPYFKKMAIILAGPMANFLMAFVIFFGFSFFSGAFTQQGVVIYHVEHGSVAQHVGLQYGDHIVAVDGQPVGTIDIFKENIKDQQNKPFDVTFVRQGGEHHVQVHMEKEGHSSYHLGVLLGPSLKKYDVLLSLRQSWVQFYVLSGQILNGFKQLVLGKASIKDLHGPVGIAKVSSSVAHKGVSAFLMFIALLSINIGFINLFPLPILDGGRLCFITLKLFVSNGFYSRVFLFLSIASMFLLIFMLLFVTFNDLGYLTYFSK